MNFQEIQILDNNGQLGMDVIQYAFDLADFTGDGITTPYMRFGKPDSVFVPSVAVDFSVEIINGFGLKTNVVTA